MSAKPDMREGIQRMARDLYESRKGKVSQEQCLARVRDAVKTGDKKRANGNK